MAKKQTSNAKTPAKKSTGKSLAILLVGLAGALAIAVFLARGSGEETVSDVPLDMSVAAAARMRGPEDATVTLTEFGDYQCPSCGSFHPVVSQLLARFPADLKLEFHHFPLLSIHPNALPAAIAAEAAAQQGRFWEMHDLLFDFQPAWSSTPDPETLFVSYAERLGLDRDQFLAAYRSEAIQARVLEDVVQGRELGISGTPTFYINGRQIELPQSMNEFEGLIRDAIASAE